MLQAHQTDKGKLQFAVRCGDVSILEAQLSDLRRAELPKEEKDAAISYAFQRALTQTDRNFMTRDVEPAWCLLNNGANPALLMWTPPTSEVREGKDGVSDEEKPPASLSPLLKRSLNRFEIVGWKKHRAAPSGWADLFAEVRLTPLSRGSLVALGAFSHRIPAIVCPYSRRFPYNFPRGEFARNLTVTLPCRSSPRTNVTSTHVAMFQLGCQTGTILRCGLCSLATSRSQRCCGSSGVSRRCASH